MVQSNNEQAGGFTSPFDAALRYAERGWPTFPVRPDKTPFTTNGFLDATTEPERIAAWWRQWPDAGVGIATEAAGLCVIDLDMKPSEGKDGVASWTRLCDEHGRHDCGLVASTPSGGRHYVYLMPEGGVRTGANIIAGSGIDVRANGAYIVAPSPADPKREWIAGDPFEANTDGSSDVGPMPPWVIELVTRERASAHATGSDSGAPLPLDETSVARIREALAFVCNDERQDWIHVGMALKSTGAREQAFALWEEWSRATLSGSTHPKYDAIDQRYQWRSIHEYRMDGSEITLGTLFKMARDGGWQPSLGEQVQAEAEIHAAAAPSSDAKPAKHQPPRPFPLELLNCPGLVGEMTAWMLANSPRPQPALCLASALTSLGALLGRRVATPSDLRTNLYSLGIGETGCGKDPSVKLPQLLFAHAGLSKFIGPGEWKSDSGLRSALIESPSHVCLVDEFTKFLAAMSGKQVPPHIQGIKGYLLKLFPMANGVFLAPAYADRKTNAPVEIPEPNLCLYGTGVPSELFTSLDRGALQDGFLNRFLVFFSDNQQPDRRAVGRATPPPELVEALKALDVATRPSGNLQSATSSMATASGVRVVPHTEGAKAFVAELERGIDAKIPQLRAKDDHAVDLWIRFVEHVLKIALVRSAADDPTRPTNEHDLAWAHGLVLWCTERLAHETLDRVSDSKNETHVKRVLRLLKAAGEKGLSSSALTRKTQWLSSGERKDVLLTLVNSAQVGSVQRPTATKPATFYFAADGDE